MAVNGSELSILQHSFLLTTDALDVRETALKQGNHGQKRQSIADSTEESKEAWENVTGLKIRGHWRRFKATACITFIAKQ